MDDRRCARYDRVVALAAEGFSLREVARWAGVSRERCAPTAALASIAPALPVADPVRRIATPPICGDAGRKAEGRRAHNSAALRREIQVQGYTGSASTLLQYVRAWRTGSRRPGRRRWSDDTTTAPADRHRFSPRQTHWLLLRPVEDLGANERVFWEAFCQESATIATAQRLVSDFGRIVHMRAVTELDAWLSQASRSRIPELVSFVRGVQRDAAVTAAVTSPHSQGQVEGHVNPNQDAQAPDVRARQL